MRAISRFLIGSGLTACLFVVSPLSALAQGAPAAVNTSSWTTFKGDAARTGSSAANVKLPLSLQWRFSSDGAARAYNTSPLVLGAPGQQRVYFAVGRAVFCLDAQTGQRIWKTPDFLSELVTPLTLLSSEAGDLILVAGQRGRVAALRTVDGGRVWESDTKGNIGVAGPIVVNTTKGQRIVCALNAGRLVAFAPDGTLDPDWQVALPRASISSSMSLSGDGTRLFLCASDSKLYAIDVQTATIAYSVPLMATSTVTPAVVGDQVIIGTGKRISAHQSASGTRLWEFDAGGLVISSPAVSSDAAGQTVIFAGTRNGLFYALDQNGAPLWKTQVEGGISGTPLALPTVVVVGASNGLLLAFDRVTGNVVWRYRLKSERVVEPSPAAQGAEGAPVAEAPPTEPQIRTWGVSSSPSVIDNQLFVQGDNAALYAFTSRNFDAAPPRLIEPSLAVPDDKNKITALLLAPNSPPIVPGQGPIYFAAQMDDTGSGIDAASIQASLDDVPLAAEAIGFKATSGLLTLTLLGRVRGGPVLPDGLKNLTLTLRDYAGNTLRYSASFLIDNTAPAPVSPLAPPPPVAAPNPDQEPQPQPEPPPDNGGQDNGGQGNPDPGDGNGGN